MKALIQRSKNSRVLVDGKPVGEIEHGIVLFICFEKEDPEELIQRAVKKILALRIFSGPDGKMNRSITDTDGAILCISQFTLSWDGKKGNRPSFDQSMAPEQAENFYNRFCDELRKFVSVETGSFGEMMEVQIKNDGPVTFMLDWN